MARHRSNENVCNLEFHHVQTSASKKVMITVSDPFPLMWQYLDRQQLQTHILVITSSAMRVEKLSKAIWFISSGVTTKMLKSVWLFHGKSVRRSDAGRDGGIESADWGIRLLHSRCTSLPIHCGHFILITWGTGSWIVMRIKGKVSLSLSFCASSFLKWLAHRWVPP